MLVVATATEDGKPSVRVLAHAKNNLCMKGPSWAFEIIPPALMGAAPHVEWGTQYGKSADELFGGHESPGAAVGGEALKAATTWLLLRLIGRGPVLSTQLYADAQAAGIAIRTLHRARAGQAGIKVTGDKATGRWWWSH